MCDRLSHRGPDAYGYFSDGRVALGHRRLSIIDVEGGRQPLANEDGSVQVVFNGEIYNYRELRRGLLQKGHRFLTNSDTEVLVHLYEEAGERLPELLNGMFAFAIWDSRRQVLFLARDRLGKKPVYYTFNAPGTRFCFASELKALAALPGFCPRIHLRSLADFLTFSYVPDPQSIYDGVYRLAPGHSLTIAPAGNRLCRYWTPSFFPSMPARFEDAMEELLVLAQDSVRSRLLSDVPLGAFLSGGLDSSAVVALMASERGERVRTFSIGFREKAFDERAFARLVARQYRTEHHEQIVAPSVHEMLSAVVRNFDEPFGDSSAIPTMYLARLARQHVTVALGGDGADELFGGYRRYRFGVLEERLRSTVPESLRGPISRVGVQYYPKFDYLPQVFRAKTLLANLSQNLGDAYFTSMSAFRDEGLEAVLSPDVRRALRGYSPRDSFRARFEPYRECSPLEQMQAVDLETYLAGDILVKLDRATMAHSLEARSPWLDYRLVELAWRMPAEWKLHGRTGKYIFRRALASYIPKSVMTRPKMGFAVPLAAWFRGPLTEAFESQVLAPEMEELLSPGEVRRLWDEHRSGLHNHDKKLWNLLMLACWRSRHCAHTDRSSLCEEVSVGA